MIAHVYFGNSNLEPGESTTAAIILPKTQTWGSGSTAAIKIHTGKEKNTYHIYNAALASVLFIT